MHRHTDAKHPQGAEQEANQIPNDRDEAMPHESDVKSADSMSGNPEPVQQRNQPEHDSLKMSVKDEEHDGCDQDERSIRNNSAAASIETQQHSVFPKSRRNFIVLVAACCGFMSPLTGNIYFPALNALSADLHVSSTLINLSLTTYLIFQGLAPTFMGDLADTAGRRPAYIIGFIIYTGACIGLALQTSYPALLILRCVQAIGSSSTIALGSAVAADVGTAAQRGTYIGFIQGGALAGPALAPILGGILAQFLGWRSIFWFSVILGGVILIPLIVAFPETSRNVVGNGSIPPQSWNRDLLSIYQERRARRMMSVQELENAQAARAALAAKRKLRFPNPLSTLKILREKDVRLLLFYNCLLYVSYYSVTSSLPFLFQQIYGFNELQVGLSYIPYGVGALLASLCNGQILDWRFRKVARDINFPIIKGQTLDTRNFPLERVRFPIALVLLLIGNTALLCYGWVLHVNAPLAAPLVLLFLIGYCLNGGFNCCSIALVDYYPNSPATATAGNNLCRCLMVAGLSAVIIPMIKGMGRGWCFTFIALIIYITTPILLILMRWGPKWREERAQHIDSLKAAKAAREADAEKGAGVKVAEK